MNLDEAQKKKVTQWINDGLKLSDIQKRLDTEFGLTMTYMEVRFLVDDLKLVPKDIEPPKPAAPLPAAKAPPAAAKGAPGAEDAELLPEAAARPPGAKVSVTVDNVTRPGSLASGNVTFSDGQSAGWYLDQMGRLGLAPKQQGYRPHPEDLQDFQAELQVELQRLGF
jgi:hypothetical protein